MNVEMSLSSAKAKARAIETLHAAGFRAASGSVRLAYPFTVLVESVGVDVVPTLYRLVRAVDPSVGMIVPVPALTPA